MEQESGTTAAVSAAAGTFLSLNEHEQRYYSGLHAVCQADTSGKLSSPKVAELFKASQLPPEALHKVTEVCGAKRLGYFGTAQFYVALKLLAAAQSGLPIRLESVTANLPLPRFVGLQSEAEIRYPSIPAGGVEGQVAASATGPGLSWTGADRSAYRHVEPGAEKKELWSPPRSPCTSPPRSPSSYRSYPYSRNGAEPHMVYPVDIHSSRSGVQLEPHSSPSNYGTKPSADLSSAAAIVRAGSSERLDQQGADYPDDDPWRITEEQLQYYTNQFTSLQPDLGALIIGAVAKDFFTKSKLPIPELSHIWELSDMDRDGALTFSEFCTAFHLIVARKNGYPLPESLPPTLRLAFVQPEEDIPETPENIDIVERLQPQIKPNASEEATKQADTTVRIAATLEPTPEPMTFPQRPDPPQELDPQMKTKTRPRSYSSTSIEDAIKKAEEPPTPPPRPQKSHSRASSLDLNKLFQQGALGAKSGWLPPPPALPPRPAPSQVPHFAPEKPPQNKVQQPNFADFSHFREEEESSAKGEGQSVRSRFGPSTEEDLTGASKQDLLHSAPQKPVRRKYHTEVPNMDVPPPAMTLAPPTKAPQKVLSKQKREIQMAIRKNKETNAVLKRLNSELQQQLKVVHQERVTLESQLELVRPVATT
ncbi:ralBP1-associated Eps domain-containing protein 2 isoform X2 [Boleophthalmus pectinirostris]|uniref:ralBP1-associated Eps domain-containing protein 2 isoform X2 n=1 Tax=Boleophthalmus pectinirostris TaxID=150288 RepID=UPI00242C6A43|nr:ralBP1-associated Eps domain-containing protein 2 isoform X2 [Boleophthalmus pectinirostris]